MLGIFRAGQASVAATSPIAICKPTRPCDGFSRSLGRGTGPGFVPQLLGAFRKLPSTTALFFSVLTSLGASALATVPHSAIATTENTMVGKIMVASWFGM